MRWNPHADTGRSRFCRPRVAPLIGLGFGLALSAGCSNPQSWLYVANTTPPVIQILSVQPGGTQNLPQAMLRQNGNLSVSSGAPMALHVAGNTLYAVTGSGAVAQYTIDPITGDLSLRGTISAGSPPYEIAASASHLYVANRGSGNVSVFSIDAMGNLASLQTTTADAVNAIQIDTARRLLFTGSRANGTAGPKVCAHTLQTDGSLPAGPGNCVAVSGAPESMPYTGGVLYLLHNGPAPTGLGNTNWVSAWTVGATGNLAQRGLALDVGAANASGLTASADGRFLFLPRQGSFQTITAADPLQPANTTPVTNSPACVWPPAAAGGALIDRRANVLYVRDPVGLALGSPQGARVSTLAIDANGALTPYMCETVGGKPISMAMFIP